MSMKIERKGNAVTLTFTLADKAQVSNTEAAKAAKEGRSPVAKALFTSGGFMSDGQGAKYSLNVITA